MIRNQMRSGLAGLELGRERERGRKKRHEEGRGGKGGEKERVCVDEVL
jgi:hypothetical protein